MTPSLSTTNPVPSPLDSRWRTRPKNGDASSVDSIVLTVTTLGSARCAIGANDIGAA